MAFTDKSQRIESRDELVAFLEAGNKPAEKFRIGTEHEKFGYIVDGQRPLPYDGPQGVRAMLEGMQRFGWQPVYEGDNVIALMMDGASITLEPGGQFELSGAPLETVHQTCDEVHTHLKQVREVADEIGVGFIGLGFSPTWTYDETPIMPKGRYKIMRSYMPKVGGLGVDMMFRSATVQTNLDFSSELDMVRKFRTSLALQPIATALFANSPFTEGKPNGFVSFRSQIWTDTDPDRTGMLPFVFEDGMGFERYTDYALDVPMYFVNRGGDYVDVSGQSFRAFMKGELKGLEGEVPTIDDWEAHLTTIFPEVRLKRFLEMRGTDGGPWASLCALPALFVGLLYSSSALTEAEALVADWTIEEREAMRNAVPVHGLNTPFRGGTILPIAKDVLAIARRGLLDRAKQDGLGGDETSFLTTLDKIVASGKTPAEVLLQKYENEWKGDLSRLFIEESY